MKNKTSALLAVSAFAAASLYAQDASALLQKSSIALGSANLNSIQVKGTGHQSALGQNYLPDSPWPETTITAYTVTFDYANKSSREELTRVQNTPPSKGGGAPFGGEQRQVNIVSGNYAWAQPGAQANPQPGAAAERQLTIWLTPYGFLKAAMENHGTMKKGKGGTDVTFTAMGKYKVVGTIDAAGLVTKVETWVPNPVLGDMLVEAAYADYKDFGGLKVPTKIVESEGGHPILDLTLTDAKANPGLALTVPDNVQKAQIPPVKVESTKLGDGVWWLGGGTHNSLVVEFKGYSVVVETPLTEQRAEAVLAEARKLVPNKPIKYVVNTHHHWDHSGGLRAVAAEGIPIITAEANKPFYEKAWKAPHTLDPDMLAKKPRKATFITVKDKYEITDGTQTLQLFMTSPNDHNGDMLIGYIPSVKALIVADLFTPAPPNAPALVPLAATFANQLYENIQRLKLDIKTIAPLHGNVAPYDTLLKSIGKG